MEEMSIRQVRRAKEITQQEMADALNVHVQTYRKLEEHPENMTIAQAQIAANKLGMTYDDFNFTPIST